jgi:hypothetical protein
MVREENVLKLRFVIRTTDILQHIHHVIMAEDKVRCWQRSVKGL